MYETGQNGIFMCFLLSKVTHYVSRYVQAYVPSFVFLSATTSFFHVQSVHYPLSRPWMNRRNLNGHPLFISPNQHGLASLFPTSKKESQVNFLSLFSFRFHIQDGQTEFLTYSQFLRLIRAA